MRQWLPIIVGVVILVVAAFLILRTQSTEPVNAPTSENLALSTPSQDNNQVATRSEPATGVDLMHMDIEQFRVLSQEVTKSLPTKSDLAKMPSGEVHLTPGPVLDAGEKLGQIATAVSNNPSLGNEAMAFYLDCANASLYPDSVRALCLSNYRMLGKKQNISTNDGTVPLEVKKLAEKLQGL